MSTELSKRLLLISKPLLLLLLAWLFTACALTSDNKSVFLADELSFLLTAPPTNKIATVESHLVVITSKDQTHQFIAQVEYRRDEIAMAAISPQGLPLFDFIWFSDKASEVNQYVPLPSVDIAFIIADMQLCNWPLEAVKSALIGTNVDVNQSSALPEKNIIWQRSVTQNNKVIIKIEKRDDGYELENLIRGYRIRLTNLERENS
tara:strand:+ start:15591 stop:16205 length:615 start_codon:yes stop_codon:yes gene_type:complete